MKRAKFLPGQDLIFRMADTLNNIQSRSSSLISGVVQIARQCDGLRCDMAILPDVFKKTWGAPAFLAGSYPAHPDGKPGIL
jgi:hypothetical protein